MKDIEKKGIYKIFNMVDGRYYVGSATISFAKRETQHISDLAKNKHRNIHLQRAYNKYGHENFVFVIVEILDLSDKEIILREQWHLDQNADYNIATIAENSAKGRKMTPEQLAAHSERLKGKSTWNKGIPFSEESKKKMSEAKKGKSLPKTINSRTRSRAIKRSDGKLYLTVTEAAKDLNTSPNNILSCIARNKQGRNIKACGYKFEYLEYDDPMRYVTPCKAGWAIKVKGQYLGYTSNLDEAKQIRDEYLKSLDKQE